MEQISPNGTPHGGTPASTASKRPTPPPAGLNRVNWAIWILSATAIGFTLRNAAFFFIWVTSAFMLFALVDPGVQRLSRRGISPTVSAFFLIAILCVGIGGLFALLYFSIDAIVRDLDNYRDVFSQMLDSVHKEITKWLRLITAMAEGASHRTPAVAPAASPAAAARPDIFDLPGKIGSTLMSGLANAVSVISFLFLTPLLTFFLLLERRILAQVIVITFRLQRRELIVLWRRITGSVAGFFFGSVILLTISLPLFILLFFAFGVTSPLHQATIASLLNLIPFVGAVTTGLFPCLNLLIHGSSLTSAAALYLLCVVFHFFFANVITPKAIGHRLDLNATTSLIAAIGLGELWGIAGLILGIPLMAILKTFMEFSRRPEVQLLAALMSNNKKDPRINQRRTGLRG